MSVDNGEYDPEEGNRKVIDEEEFVDQRIKERILDSRERVNQREDALFNGRLLEPDVEISQRQAVVSWGNTVRQFVRDIKPLLTSDEITAAKAYFEEKAIGEMTLIPPDTGGYPFSRVAQSNQPDGQLTRALGLSPGSSAPQPHTIEFAGLQDILKREPTVSYQWQVCVDDTGPPPEQEWLYPTVQQPIPKRIYANAVELADDFLNQAGIGLNTGLPEVDDTGRAF